MMSKAVAFLGALAVASAKSGQSPRGTDASSPQHRVRAHTEYTCFCNLACLRSESVVVSPAGCHGVERWGELRAPLGRAADSSDEQRFRRSK